MTDDPIDFSAFDVQLDDVAQNVATRCAPLLAERRRARTVVQIVEWRRPMIAAALVIAAASAFALSRDVPEEHVRAALAVRSAPSRLAPLPRLGESLGVPTELASRLTMRVPPTMADLLGQPR
ncbi:MAG TPA: hypothetical protein VGH98_18440 [Gemmatimonadaceae bacterium]|jgi:hypothetical protein